MRSLVKLTEKGNAGENHLYDMRRNPPRLNRNQVRSFWAAWAGWTMDGMDSFIYSCGDTCLSWAAFQRCWLVLFAITSGNRNGGRPNWKTWGNNGKCTMRSWNFFRDAIADAPSSIRST